MSEGWPTDPLTVLRVHVNTNIWHAKLLEQGGSPRHTIENGEKDAGNVKNDGCDSNRNISIHSTLTKSQHLPSRTSKKRREVGYRYLEFFEYRQRDIIVITKKTVS